MAGRQSGKTRTGIIELAIDAMANPGHINWWIAPNYRVKDKPWRELLAFIPADAIKKKNETELHIILVNGSEIFVKSADAPDSLVSEGLNFAVCDEAGQWKETAWTMGVRPMFTATKGRALLLGTPRGKNWFFKLWQLGRPGPQRDADYESFHWASWDSPFSDAKDIDEARRNVRRDIFEQEYGANPLDNSGGVFKNVRNCVALAPAQADLFTVIGADLARKVDFSAFIAMNSKRQALWVERSQDDWPVQKSRLSHLAFRLGARIIADSASAGDVVVQDLRFAGYAVEDVATNSQKKKNELIDNLALAFEQGTIQIPNDDVLIDELEAYSYEVLPKSNTIRYSAPDGQHDDTVIALALALWGQRGSMYQRPIPTTYARSRGGTYMRSST